MLMSVFRPWRQLPDLSFADAIVSLIATWNWGEIGDGCARSADDSLRCVVRTAPGLCLLRAWAGCDQRAHVLSGGLATQRDRLTTAAAQINDKPVGDGTSTSRESSLHKHRNAYGSCPCSHKSRRAGACSRRFERLTQIPRTNLLSSLTPRMPRRNPSSSVLP